MKFSLNPNPVDSLIIYLTKAGLTLHDFKLATYCAPPPSPQRRRRNDIE